MAYKKYIKKNGKIYGPYIYHSKRVDGKVVSEYRGLKQGVQPKVNKKHFVFIFAAVALILFFSLFFTLKPGNLTGNVVLNLESHYQEDQPLEGVLNINLNEGEMLPENSEIIFENAGDSYKYNLSELINSEFIEGDFFVQGQDSFGQGLGYGLIGKQVIYPDVYFKFEVVESDLEEGSESVNDVLQEGASTSSRPLEEPEGKQPIVEEVVESKDVPSEEPEGKEPIVEEVQEVLEEPETVSEPVEEVPEQSPLTGGVIANVFGAISRTFVGLTSTGEVVSEEGDQIQADVSYNKEFKYTLKQNQNIEIVPGSVRTDIKDLNIEDLQITREGNEVIITTDYSEETYGFGKEYLGEATKSLIINLSSLDFNFKDPNLKIKLIYEELELKSFKVDLGESFMEESGDLSLEDSEELGFTLTNKEKNILNNEFGNISVEQTARSYKDWIIVKLELRDYEVEYSYNKDLSREDLNSLIEKDKINWLKDVAKKITTEETPSFRLDEFNKNSDLS